MVTVHAHPRLVAVRAGRPDKGGRREFSSGLLIAPRLVLTARHGVAKDGAALDEIDVSFVAGARGAVRLSSPVPGTAAWLGAHDVDAALIELTGGAGAPPDGFIRGPLIWGEPAGTKPIKVQVTGLPWFAAKATGELVEVETARGELDPGTYAVSDRYAVNLSSAWPETWEDWRGVSGAAIACDKRPDLILGVTVWADTAFAGRRLTAVPVRTLLTDSRFRSVLEKYLDRLPEVKPVELVPLLLATPSKAGTPGALLRANAGLTEFTGRADELERLQRWRDEPAADGPDVKALLITGRGGEGKTRLALELLERSKQDGWAGGMLNQNVSPDEAAVVAPPSRPLLLVVDYAAARASGIVQLLNKLIQAWSSAPVRLLLIARAKGDWWSDLAAELADDLPNLDEQVLPLGPLLADNTVLGPEPSVSDRAAMFTTTAAVLAPQASQFTRRTPAELRDIAARLTVPDLSDVRYGHALNVQMSALAALLEEADGTSATAKSVDHVEDILLRHEKQYRDKLAKAQPGVDALKEVRDRAVVGAALFGARGPGKADAQAAACAMVTAAVPEVHRHVSKQRTVAKWIAELYPPDEPEPGAATEYWGEVLPDRLGEFLAVRLLAAEETTLKGNSLLASLAVRSDLTGIGRALLMLSRAADHDPRSNDWIIRLVAADPANTGRAALLVASYAENPTLLRAALVHLGQQSPEQLQEAAAAVHDALPEFSVQALKSSTALTREIVNVFSALAGHRREAWLPSLARYLASLAGRLTDVRRHAEALDISSQAFDAYSELAAADRKAYLPEFARVMERHSERLAVAGRSVEADEVSAKAQEALHELIIEGRIPAVSNAGPTEDRPSAESIDRRARAFQDLIKLATASPRYLPYLVQGANIHAAWLTEAERKAETLDNYGKVVQVLAVHAAAHPDVYLPNLAAAAFDYANRLAEARNFADALRASAQALHAYEELAAAHHDVYLPDLAKALGNHAAWLAQAGQLAQAVDLSAQAVDAYKELVAADRDAHLSHLTSTLALNGLILVRSGRVADAVAVLVEGLKSAMKLPNDSGSPLAKTMVGNLRTAYEADPRQFEVAYRNATGSEFPEELRQHRSD